MKDSFSDSGTYEMPKKWWKALGDPTLDELIDKALSDNLNLKIVWDRLDQSVAIAKKSGVELSPAVDFSAGVSQSMTKSPGSDVNFTDSLSLGIVASYELDLWGRVDSSADAAKLDLEATQEDLYVSAITLTAEVANTWYKIVEKRGQLDLLDKQIQSHEDYLEIVTMRFRQGQVPSTDVLQQRQSLEAARESKIRAESDLKVLEHQMAVLLGVAPGFLDIPAGKELPKLPPLPKTGLPAELIRRRPDTESAFYRVLAADERIASAIANKYPRISLTASLETTGSTDTGSSKLFENWLATLAGNLLLPIFDAGEREAEVERTRAVRSEAFNRYGEVTLNALKEVEDALTREALQMRRLESIDKQYELSGKSVSLTRERYVQGVEDFLRLINTLLNHHNLERDKLTAKRELLEYRIALYRALGGSWELERKVEKKKKNDIKTLKHNEGGRDNGADERGDINVDK